MEAQGRWVMAAFLNLGGGGSIGQAFWGRRSARSVDDDEREQGSGTA